TRSMYTVADPVDFSGPFKAEARVAADRFALGERTVCTFALPAMKTFLGDHALGDVWGTNGPDKRQYTMRLRTTRKATFEESIRVPAGWTFDSLPDPVKLDGPAASLDFGIEKSASELRYHCELIIKKHRISPDEYGQYKQVLDAFDKLVGGVV